MRIDELLTEILDVTDRFWFIQSFEIIEQTDNTITIRLIIGPELFVQIFLSQRSGRFSLALIDASGRIYGRDREHGQWHRHPFGNTAKHEISAEGMSLQPLQQFLSEVEEILVENDLI